MKDFMRKHKESLRFVFVFFAVVSVAIFSFIFFSPVINAF